MRRREETLNAYYCMKEVNMWRLSTVWFQLNDIVEKAELSLFTVSFYGDSSKDQGLPAVEGKMTRQSTDDF